MENQFIKISEIAECAGVYDEFYDEYYQLHILSFSHIVSTYYKRDIYKLQNVKLKALETLDSIRNRSDNREEIILYEYDGIFLISNSSKFINYEELFSFNYEKGRYEYIDNPIDLFDYLGDKQVGTYFKNAIISVGAKPILSVVDKYFDFLSNEQIRLSKLIEELRTKDAASPKYRVEIYSIEKNYKPNKIKEFLCASVESAYSRPEIIALANKNNRTTMLIKEIDTGKVIDGSLEEAIESIKFEKWQRKHPSVIDMEVANRMDLDNNDPNFLSYDDYLSNDDEYEEGDDEYEPRF